MSTIRELYPFHVRYERTADWYSNAGTWYQLSTWCIQNFGHSWEYLDSTFMFSKLEHKMWFELKWK